jgi:hypothetical protein
MLVTREKRRQLAIANAKQPATLTPVPREKWPEMGNIGIPSAVFRSRTHLVQVYDEGDGMQRLSILRTQLNKAGEWVDGIPWDELQDIKRQIGMGDKYAIEIYPRDRDIVNVANLRHLWVLDQPLSIGWTK